MGGQPCMGCRVEGGEGCGVEHDPPESGLEQESGAPAGGWRVGYALGQTLQGGTRSPATRGRLITAPGSAMARYRVCGGAAVSKDGTGSGTGPSQTDSAVQAKKTATVRMDAAFHRWAW